MKQCLECGAEFEPRVAGRPQKYCSRKCFSKRYYRHPDDARDAPKDAICGVCSKPFVKIKRNQRYCSRTCYKRISSRIGTRNYRAKHIDAMCTYERMFYGKNRPKLLSSRPWHYLLKSRKNEASLKKLDFDLTDAWACARWTGACEITKIVFRITGKKGPHPFSPSIDKIDPSKGYTQDNCRFVLMGCNMLKGGGTDADMYEIAKAIVDHQRP